MHNYPSSPIIIYQFPSLSTLKPIIHPHTSLSPSLSTLIPHFPSSTLIIHSHPSLSTLIPHYPLSSLMIHSHPSLSTLTPHYTPSYLIFYPLPSLFTFPPHFLPSPLIIHPHPSFLPSLLINPIFPYSPYSEDIYQGFADYLLWKFQPFSHALILYYKFSSKTNLYVTPRP